MQTATLMNAAFPVFPVRHYIVFAVVLALVTSTACAAKPNVVFIAVDDLNDWIGCMKGHPQALTPNIDRLAARGVLFTNSHCAAPACNPSRAAVFSGRMPNVTGVWSNQSGSLSKLHSEARTLTTAFCRAGYRTLGTGKLLHSGGRSDFDEYYSVGQRWSPFEKEDVEYTPDELRSKGSANPRHVLKDSQGRIVVLPLNRMPSDRRPTARSGESFDWGPFDVPDSDFGDTQITDWAIGKLKKKPDQPLFLAVGYYRPHIPLWAPNRFFDRFEKTPAELPPVLKNDLADLSRTAKKWALEPVTAGSHATVVEYRQWQAAVEAYLACVSYVDHEIGRLLDALDRSGIADNTVIVLWSDHGWHLGEKQHWGKWTGWERSTRVPLIIVPPRKQKTDFASDARCKEPVSLVDLYPTLVELCGADGPQKLDGQSLVPLLRNPRQRSGRGVVTMFDRGNTSLRTDRWRLIRYADGSEELYDHSRDSHEWENLAGNPGFAEIQKQLSRQLDSLTAR